MDVLLRQQNQDHKSETSSAHTHSTPSANAMCSTCVAHAHTYTRSAWTRVRRHPYVRARSYVARQHTHFIFSKTMPKCQSDSSSTFGLRSVTWNAESKLETTGNCSTECFKLLFQSPAIVFIDYRTNMYIRCLPNRILVYESPRVHNVHCSVLPPVETLSVPRWQRFTPSTNAILQT